MSLYVPGALLDRAKSGDVTDAEFVDCIRDSLPYAWKVVSDVAGRLHSEDGEYAEDNSVPPSEVEQGQLRRHRQLAAAAEQRFGADWMRRS